MLAPTARPSCSALSSVFQVRQEPGLCRMARWNRPAQRGDDMKADIALAPDDSPKIVTLSGSPPKRSMFALTHCSACAMSRMP